MGYTHHWSQKGEISPEKWVVFADGARRLVAIAAANGIDLAFEYDEPRTPPCIDPDQVRFNGIEDDGHETFLIERDGDKGGFCKTNRKPYDTACVAILCYLTSVHGGVYEVGSDGHTGNWRDGLELARKAWPGVTIGLPPGLREEDPDEAAHARELQERANRYLDEAQF